MAGNAHAVAQLEAEHGFVFGLPDDGYETANAAVRQHVRCTTDGCTHAQGEAVPVHEDTVHPVTCGGCGAVLLCDHQPEARPTTKISGPLTAPVITEETRCARCGTVVGTVVTEAAPVRVEELDSSVLAALGVSFAPRTGD